MNDHWLIFVQPAGLHGPALEHWITQATDHARACRASTEYARPATDEAAGTGRYGRGEPGGQHRRWPHLVGAPRAGSGWEPSEPSRVTITTAALVLRVSTSSRQLRNWLTFSVGIV